MVFYAGVGAVLLILMMLKWLPISADWELPLILFGLGILFYVKRVLWKDEKVRAKMFSPFYVIKVST